MWKEKRQTSTLLDAACCKKVAIAGLGRENPETDNHKEHLRQVHDD